jgi:putative hemolysin
MVAAHAELSDEERALIDDVFDAGDRELREVMVPRTEVDFLDAATPLRDAIPVAAAAPHSRYPVIRDSSDDVVGFVHIRDLLDPSLVSTGLRVGDLVREVARFPGTKAVIPALTEMRRRHHHLAIVVDEYGGTAGIVTMEDLVEELVGDIQDEYDVSAAPRPTPDSGPVEVDGLLNLEDFADETGIELPEGPYETVAGFMVSRLGRLPEVDAVVAVDTALLRVAAVDGLRLARVEVTRPTEPAPVDGDEPSEPTPLPQ